MDFCPSSIIVFDKSGTIIEVNKSAAEVFGYSKQELRGCELEKLLSLSLFNIYKESNDLTLGDGRTTTAKCKDGSKLKVEVGINFFEGEEELYWVANIVDVTKAYRMRHLIERTQEIAKIGSWQVDLRKNKCSWSKMTYRIHELDEDTEVLLEDGINFYCPEDRPVIKECVEECISNKTPWDTELRIVTTKGEERWVRAIGSAIIEKSEVVGLEGTFQDIHEAKQVILERELLLAKLQRTEDLSEMGHWEWTLGSKSLEWSKGLYKLSGLDPSEAPPSIEGHREWIHPEDRDTFFNALDEGIRNQKRYEVKFRAIVDGNLKYIRMEGTPLFQNDKLASFFGTAQDITKQLLSENEVKSLNNRLTLALEASKIGTFEWNLKTNDLLWDDQMYKLYGRSKEGFEGAYIAWENGLHPDDKEETVELLERAVKGEAKFDTEFRVVWPDGRVRYIRALASLDYETGGEVGKVIGLNWDITREKESEEKLVKTNKSLEVANDELIQFSYRTSHDLKGPLVSIRGLGEAVLEDIDDEVLDEARRNVQAMIHQAKTLEVLVSDLLNLARADATDDKLKQVNFQEIVDEVIALNQSDANRNGVELLSSISISSNWKSSKVRILQIINNLVSNSVKYYDSKKANHFAKISIEEASERVSIVVEDNGTGIAYKEKSEVFEMFKRFHSRSTAGSGLGMYLLKKHVDALGGDVDFVTSSKGTIFTVRIGKNERIFNTCS